MRLTKRHKISLVVLVIGLVGLAVDRVLLLPGSAAGEQVMAVDQTPPKKGVVEKEAAADDSNSVAVGESLSDRLDTLWAGREFDPSTMRDAFSVPALWSDVEHPGSSSVPDAVSRFVLAHSLNATVVNGKQSCARVDGRSLMLGAELDGFILVSVDETSASFEADGRTVVLTLIGADNTGSKK